jgi:hypothetical protein
MALDRPSFAKQDDLAVANMQTTLATVSKNVDEARDNWTVLTTNGLVGAQCRGRHAIRASEVQQDYSRLRVQVLERLADKRLAPLKAWVEETVPSQAPPADTELAKCFPGPAVVSEEVANARLNDISVAARKIAHLNSLTLSVRISTRPSDGAHVQMHPLRYSALVVDEATPTGDKRLYRGIYMINVVKPGFVPIADQEIILLDPENANVQCTLVASQSASTSSCRFQ